MNENNLNYDANIVGMLRDKTEEADLNQVLKSSFGGYTKKSVQEYFSVIRKQQQTSQQTFSKNLQTLFEEKESIKKNNETLLARYNKLLAEYDNLSESLKNIKIDDSEISAKDVVSLKSRIVSLEEENKKTEGEKKSLEKIIDQLNRDKSDLENSLKRSKEETKAQLELFKSERNDSITLRDTIADISRQLEEEKNEVKYLKGIMSEGKYAELNSNIDELNQQLSTQTDVISKLNAQNILKDNTIEILNDEIAAFKHRLNSMLESVQGLNLQNDKLMVANEMLKEKLHEEYKKSIDLINEKAYVSIDKLIAQKKLGSAESKIVSLEMALDKLRKSEETTDLQNKITENNDIEN